MAVRRISMYGVAIFAVIMMLLSYGPAVLANGSWVDKADMSNGRAFFGSVEVDGKIYIIGGRNGNNILNSVEMYDPLIGTWTSKASMSVSRHGLGVTMINGKIYAIGGYDAAGTHLSVVEEYTPSTDTWVRKADMPTPRGGLSVSAVNGMIYAIGGRNGSYVEVYDPNTDTWTQRTNAPYIEHGAGRAVFDGKIYLFGGYIYDLTQPGNTAAVHVYDPVAGTWSSKASMPVAIRGVSSVVYNGKIYCIGGLTTSAVNTVYIYDPTSNIWTSSENISIPRVGLEGINSNGTLYVMGGTQDSSINAGLKTVEEYIPEPDAPTNLIAVGGSGQVELSWNSIINTTGYHVLRSTTSSGPYTTVETNVYGTSYTDYTVTPGTTYYFVVTALNGESESQYSNEVSATPQELVDSRALLVITMSNGLGKEYDLPMADVSTFLSWYEGRANGAGSSVYIMNKGYNQGPFSSRKDYIIYDKILMFEVNEYAGN